MARRARSVALHDVLASASGGRGTADNKGQHAINIAALRAVHEARGGKLGFNAKFIIEMGEEIGSPDLPKVCEAHREELKADLFLASDGPRLSAERPTIFLGCRGGRRIHLDIELRDGAHHSGNWGGLLANPATILASAIATLVDRNGRIKLDALKPPRISNQVRAALAGRRSSRRPPMNRLCRRTGAKTDCRRRNGSMPGIRWKCWRSVPAISTIPPMPFPARPARCCSFASSSAPISRMSYRPCEKYLAGNGFADIKVSQSQYFSASRTDIDNPWVGWARRVRSQDHG